MKKISIIPTVLFILFLTLTGCKNVVDGLTGNKKSNKDEFLIEKKNPLTKPPNYEDLPNPDNAQKENEENESDDFNLRELLKKSSENKVQKKNTKSQNKNLENSILDKIKNN